MRLSSGRRVSKSVQAMVREDLVTREAFGTRKYGRPLGPFDGRDTLMDAYEEALDLCCYLRKAIEERDLKSAKPGDGSALAGT